MRESVDSFLNDLNRRFPVDDRFKQNIRPLVERIFDRSIPREERERLLNLVEQTYQRQVENRESLDRAKEGIRRIFSNLYKKILKDLGPQIQKLNRRMEDGGEIGSGEPAADGVIPEVEPGANPDEGSAGPGESDTGEPKPLLPQEPVWSEEEEDPTPAEGDALPRRKDLLFGEFLVRRGVLGNAALLGALEEQVRAKPLLGWVGLRRGVLTEAQVLKVLTRQVAEGRRFGEIALEEGFLDLAKLDVLWRVQKKYTPMLGKILVTRGDLSLDALTYFLNEFAAEGGRK